jgi:hypothetical protein
MKSIFTRTGCCTRRDEYCVNSGLLWDFPKIIIQADYREISLSSSILVVAMLPIGQEASIESGQHISQVAGAMLL